MTALAEFGDALDRCEHVAVTTVRLASGHERTHIVWFVREAEALYLLPYGGARDELYLELIACPSLRIVGDEIAYRAHARAITEPFQVRQVIERFRRKYPPRYFARARKRYDAALIAIPEWHRAHR